MIFPKQQLLIALIVMSSFYTNAQNLGIGTTTPAYKLTVQSPTNDWGFANTDGNVVLGSYIYSTGIAEFGTRSRHSFCLFANNFDNPPAIAIDSFGLNVGIGNRSPIYSLDVHSTGNAQFNLMEGIGGQTALFSRYTNRLEIQPSDAFEISIGGIDKRNLCIAHNGNIGIANATPNNQLEIGIAPPGITGSNLAIGNGTEGMAFYQSKQASVWYSDTSFSLMPSGNGNGYVGIGTEDPLNNFQIGNNIPSFSGHIFAMENANAGMGFSFNVFNTSVWDATSDISIVPAGGTTNILGDAHISGNANISGNTCIGCSTPIAPLEVDSYSTPAAYGYAFYNEQNNSANSGYLNFSPEVSISAAQNIVAEQFDARSDARIKDIEDVSNSTKDLQTLNAIQVTDYTMKDKVKDGDKQFKKIIAQQVEEVYPQIVNKNVGYIPNVYQLTNKIDKTTNGYLLSFKTAHHLDKDAKKLQLIDKAGMQQRYDIISIPSDKEVLINVSELKSDTLFVYGEQVNDFRTVDYDGLTTLNISATQELSKLVKKQQDEIDMLISEVNELKTKH